MINYYEQDRKTVRLYHGSNIEAAVFRLSGAFRYMGS